jgi:Zn-dependent M28 family amino/carboxypeptidase
MFNMPAKSYRGELPVSDDALAALTDELRQYVRCLAVDIGERNLQRCPEQLAHAADYIEAQFKGFDLMPQRQGYAVIGCHCCNLDVEIQGTISPNEVVIVGAHYDTVVGSPGANDNASGVAAILALARRLTQRPTGRTLRFVAFVNEENPYAGTDQMGSRVYARRCRQRNENVVAMMSLETIGYYDDRPGSQKYPPPFGLFYPSTGNFIGFIGNLKSDNLVRQVVGTFRRSELFPSEGAALPELIRRIGHSDHASFWREGYRALMVTDTADFRYPHYHMPEDTIDKVNFDRLARVVRGLEQVVLDLGR